MTLRAHVAAAVRLDAIGVGCWMSDTEGHAWPETEPVCMALAALLLRRVAPNVSKGMNEYAASVPRVDDPCAAQLA